MSSASPRIKLRVEDNMLDRITISAPTTPFVGGNQKRKRDSTIQNISNPQPATPMKRIKLILHKSSYPAIDSVAHLYHNGTHKSSPMLSVPPFFELGKIESNFKAKEEQTPSLTLKSISSYPTPPSTTLQENWLASTLPSDGVDSFFAKGLKNPFGIFNENLNLRNILQKDVESDRLRPQTEKRARAAVRYAAQNNPKLSSDYELLHLLGWGGNGAVVSAKSKRNLLMEEVAIKLIYKVSSQNMRGYPAKTEKQRNLPWEIQILSQIDHPNVLKYIEWFEDDYAYYLVTEKFGYRWKDDKIDFAKGTSPLLFISIPSIWSNQPTIMSIPQLSGSCDLFSFIDYYNSCVPISIIRCLFKQIASAVNHLHKLNVVHGDLKEENVLVSRDNTIRICDFGHAREVKVSPLFSDVPVLVNKQHILGCPMTMETKRHFAFYGTTEMIAPELLSNLAFKKSLKKDYLRCRGFELDVWALGLLLYSMVYGALPPQHSKILKGQASLHKHETYPLHSVFRKDKLRQDVPELCNDLISKMLIINPLDRWSMTQVCYHPWLQ